jgi:hypothetical protein
MNISSAKKALSSNDSQSTMLNRVSGKVHKTDVWHRAKRVRNEETVSWSVGTGGQVCRMKPLFVQASERSDEVSASWHGPYALPS